MKKRDQIEITQKIKFASLQQESNPCPSDLACVAGVKREGGLDALTTELWKTRGEQDRKLGSCVTHVLP